MQQLILVSKHFAILFIIFTTPLLFSSCASVSSGGPGAKLLTIHSQGPVGRTFQKNAEKFETCGEHSVTVQTGVKQKIKLQFIVTKDGRVQKPEVLRMSSPDPDLHECIVLQMRTLVFPKPKDQKAKKVRYPLTIVSG